MPFIVTTKRPHGGGVVPFILSRQAVATLPDAQRLLRAAVRDADWPRDIGGSNARQSVSGQIDDLMASGGNAIRLPDGTRIEVVAVDDAEYARAIDAGMNGPAVPGVAEGRPMRSELERIEQALDAQRQTLSHLTLPLLDEALALVRGLLAEPQEDPGVEGKNAHWWADNAAYWHGQADQYKLWRDEAMRDVADLKQQLAGAVPGPGVSRADGPVPDEAAIERGAEAARKVPSGARNRWQRVAEAVLRAALEPPA